MSFEKTPTQKYNRKRNTASLKDVQIEVPSNSYELPIITESENEESPMQIACTQEANENIDVGWDWNSPQAKRKPPRLQKRLIPPSPKVPMMRHPSNSSIQNFEKIKQQLRELREELAVADNHDLQLSPRHEAEYKDESNNVEIDMNIEPFSQEVIDDPFDDSGDEALFLFSQQIEHLVSEKAISGTGNSSDNSSKSPIMNFRKLSKEPICHSFDANSSKPHASEKVFRIENYSENSIKSPKKNFRKIDGQEPIAQMANDSFEAMVQEIGLDKIGSVDSDHHKKNNSNITTRFYRPRSENQVMPTTTGRVEFHRTESFELSNLENHKNGASINMSNQIERNRLEALAKLKSKRPQQCTTVIQNNTLSQCSLQEIERKRLLALEKRETKRQQEIIERNRQEALKRRQMSKKTTNVLNIIINILY